MKPVTAIMIGDGKVGMVPVDDIVRIGTGGMGHDAV